MNNPFKRKRKEVPDFKVRIASSDRGHCSTSFSGRHVVTDATGDWCVSCLTRIPPE